MQPATWSVILGLGFFVAGCGGGNGPAALPSLHPGPSLVARPAMFGAMSEDLTHRRDRDQGMGPRGTPEQLDAYEIRTYENEWTRDGTFHRSTHVRTRTVRRVRRSRN